MLADDFFGHVALDPLATGVPVDDDTGRTEHVQRIIRHAADEHPELAFARMEIRQDCLPLGDVTGNLRVTDQPALLVDRIDYDGGKEFRAILAKAPPLGQEVLFLARDLQGARRPACFSVFGQVEYREMLAENSRLCTP